MPFRRFNSAGGQASIRAVTVAGAPGGYCMVARLGDTNANWATF